MFSSNLHHIIDQTNRTAKPSNLLTCLPPLPLIMNLEDHEWSLPAYERVEKLAIALTASMRLVVQVPRRSRLPWRGKA